MREELPETSPALGVLLGIVVGSITVYLLHFGLYTTSDVIFGLCAGAFTSGLVTGAIRGFRKGFQEGKGLIQRISSALGEGISTGFEHILLTSLVLVFLVLYMVFGGNIMGG
jgi:hypothetical protein